MIISFSASVTGINTLLSKKFAWKINDLSTENLLDPVLNYTEYHRFWYGPRFTEREKGDTLGSLIRPGILRSGKLTSWS